MDIIIQITATWMALGIAFVGVWNIIKFATIRSRRPR